MGRSSGPDGRGHVDQVRQRIEKWRQTRSGKRSPMPEPLWAAAVALARKRGLYATTRDLCVSYGTLKTRLERSVPKEVAAKPPSSPRPTFVELGAALPFGGSGAGTSVELTRRDGAKLVIRFGAGEALDLAALVREFWGRRA